MLTYFRRVSASFLDTIYLKSTSSAFILRIPFAADFLMSGSFVLSFFIKVAGRSELFRISGNITDLSKLIRLRYMSKMTFLMSKPLKTAVYLSVPDPPFLNENPLIIESMK